jgi:hypothetical protein
MARIRSVKPELRTSLTVAEWPREVRYAWVLLWGYLDDHGRGTDEIRLIVADLFPLDRDVTERKMNSWLERMRASGSICRYEVDGRTLIHALNWKDHQRPSHPSPSRITPCPHHEREDFAEWRRRHAEPVPINSGIPPESLPNPSDVIPEVLPPRVRAEQGAGSREQGERATNIGNRLLDEHVQSLRVTPPRDVIQKTGAAIDKLVAEGIEPKWIASGLALMRAKPHLGPPLLASLVNEAMNAPPPAKPQRASGAHER